MCVQIHGNINVYMVIEMCVQTLADINEYTNHLLIEMCIQTLVNINVCTNSR